MIVVHHRVDALDVVGLDIGLVGGGGQPVGLGGRGIVTRSHVHVRRHVHQVARPGHQRLETLGAREPPVGPRRRLDRVDVVVVRARMARTALQDRLQHLDDLVRPLGRPAVEGPQSPGAKVHEALREQRGRVRIVGIAPMDLAHRVGVGAVEGRAVRAGVEDIALRQRPEIDRLLFRGARRERKPLLDCVIGGLVAFRVDRQVDVRSQAQSHAPPGHGAFGIETRRLPERPLGLVVVECVDQAQPLVEVGLRPVRARADRAMIRAQAVEQRRGVRGGGIAIVRSGTGYEAENRQRDDRNDQDESCQRPS